MKKGIKNRVLRKTRKVRADKTSVPRQTAAGKARAEGLRLFKLAGRPSKEDVVKTRLGPVRHDIRVNDAGDVV